MTTIRGRQINGYGRMGRREVLRLFAAGAGAAALAACTPTGAPVSPGSTSGTAPGTAGAAPVRRGEFRVFGAAGFDLRYDPHGRASTASTSDAINSLFFDSLTEQGVDGSIQPALAKSWEVSPDGTTWTFQLQEGVKFHNGREMTAEDVVYSIQRIKDPATGNTHGAQYKIVTAVKATDPLTVVFTLASPFAPFAAVLSDTRASIVPREAVERGNFEDNPVGTGPFKFVEIVTDQYVQTEAHTEYWRTDLPLVETLRFYQTADADADVLALRAGDVDAIWDAPGAHFQSLSSDPDFGISTGTATTFNWMWLDPRHPALGNPKVMAAINWGIDRQAMIDLVLPGLATPAGGGFLPSSFWAGMKDPVYPKRDLAKAKQLLAEAGFANGFSFKLRGNILGAGATSHLGKGPIVFQQQMKDLGIDVEVEAWDTALQIQQRARGAHGLWWGTAGTADPHQQFEFQFLPGATRNIDDLYQDQVMVDLVRKAAASSDQKERATLYNDALRQLVTTGPFVFLYNYNKFAAFRTYVKDYVHNPNTKQFREARDVWVDKA